MFFDKELCLFQIEPASQKQLFSKMFTKLSKAGCVKDSYLNGILSRENEYPTGLEVNKVGFAIPHTDSVHVSQSQICFASLKEPITFLDMTNKSHKIDVRLVFMLAMASPHEQVDILQNLMALFQDENKVEKLMEIESLGDFMKLINEAGVF